jgi:hypothetical protein
VSERVSPLNGRGVPLSARRGAFDSNGVTSISG